MIDISNLQKTRKHLKFTDATCSLDRFDWISGSVLSYGSSAEKRANTTPILA